jgi:hypothetical protein
VALTAKTTQKQCEKLTAILNELPGFHKVWSFWRKVCYKLLLSLFIQHKVVMVILFLHPKKKSVQNRLKNTKWHVNFINMEWNDFENGDLPETFTRPALECFDHVSIKI